MTAVRQTSTLSHFPQVRSEQPRSVFPLLAQQLALRSSHIHASVRRHRNRFWISKRAYPQGQKSHLLWWIDLISSLIYDTLPCFLQDFWKPVQMTCVITTVFADAGGGLSLALLLCHMTVHITDVMEKKFQKGGGSCSWKIPLYYFLWQEIVSFI